MTFDYLFIGGCPRSGTTALYRTVNGHSQIALGMERHHAAVVGRKRQITADLYSPEGFFRVADLDRRLLSEKYINNVLNRSVFQEKFASAYFRGDNIPRIYESFDTVRRAMPSARFIFCLRNIMEVASSFNNRFHGVKGQQWSNDYKIAVRMWNQYVQFLDRHVEDPCIQILQYEDFYHAYDLESRILTWLDLPREAAFSSKVQGMAEEAKKLAEDRQLNLSSGECRYLSYNADWDAYKRVVERLPSSAGAD